MSKAKPEPTPSKIAYGLKIARKVIGWSQERAEFESGVSRITIGNIETGKVDPQLSNVIKLADAYGLELKLCGAEQD